MGWIACDFDATLVEWGEGTSNPGDVLRVGKPIPKMVARIKAHLDAGEDVRIFTARVGPATAEECLQAFAGRGVHPPYKGEVGPDPVLDWMNYQRTLIEAACIAMFGRTLPITATKDFYMWKLYDDRCCQVVSNTGELVEEQLVTALAMQVAATIAEPHVPIDVPIDAPIDDGEGTRQR